MCFKNSLLLFVFLYFLSACGETEDPEKEAAKNEMSAKINRLLELKDELLQIKNEVKCRDTFDQIAKLQEEILEIQNRTQAYTNVIIEIPELAPCKNKGFFPGGWRFKIEADRVN